MHDKCNIKLILNNTLKGSNELPHWNCVSIKYIFFQFAMKAGSIIQAGVRLGNFSLPAAGWFFEITVSLI